MINLNNSWSWCYRNNTEKLRVFQNQLLSFFFWNNFFIAFFLKHGKKIKYFKLVQNAINLLTKNVSQECENVPLSQKNLVFLFLTRIRLVSIIKLVKSSFTKQTHYEYQVFAVLTSHIIRKKLYYLTKILNWYSCHRFCNRLLCFLFETAYFFDNSYIHTIKTLNFNKKIHV